MEEKTDRELIRIIEAAPDSAAARLAKEMLEYRKYIVQKRQNSGILWLTIVLTISGLVQATMATVDVLKTSRGRDIGAVMDCKVTNTARPAKAREGMTELEGEAANPARR